MGLFDSLIGLGQGFLSGAASSFGNIGATPPQTLPTPTTPPQATGSAGGSSQNASVTPAVALPRANEAGYPSPFRSTPRSTGEKSSGNRSSEQVVTVGGTALPAPFRSREQPLITPIPAATRTNAELSLNKMYEATLVKPAGGRMQGADYSGKLAPLPGIAFMQPVLTEDTRRVQLGSRQPEGYFPKEGTYTFLGAADVTQHGQTERGWLYKGAEGSYFLAKPAKDLGQEVPMSGSPAAWAGMVDTGKAKIEYLLPEGARIKGVTEVGTGRPVAFDNTILTNIGALPSPVTPKVGTAEQEWTKISSTLQPSPFSMEILKSPLATTPLAKPLIDIGEFGGTNPVFGLATMIPNAFAGKDLFKSGMIETFVGKEVVGPAITTEGKSWQEVKDLGEGSYQITTFTPSTTTQERSIPTKTVFTPLAGGFDIGEKAFAEQKTKPFIPELTFKSTGFAPLDYLESYGIGIVQGVREKPLTAATNVGLGALMVIGGEAIVGLGAATETATVARPILGPIVREGLVPFSTKVAPTILVGLYGHDVVQRSTEGMTDFSPKSAGRFGTITGQEIIPFSIGGGLVAPSKAAVGKLDIDIKAFTQEKYGVEARRIKVSEPDPMISALQEWANKKSNSNIESSQIFVKTKEGKIIQLFDKDIGGHELGVGVYKGKEIIAEMQRKNIDILDSKIINVHHHPSGNLAPSAGDIEYVRLFKQHSKALHGAATIEHAITSKKGVGIYNEFGKIEIFKKGGEIASNKKAGNLFEGEFRLGVRDAFQISAEYMKASTQEAGKHTVQYGLAKAEAVGMKVGAGAEFIGNKFTEIRAFTGERLAPSKLPDIGERISSKARVYPESLIGEISYAKEPSPRKPTIYSPDIGGRASYFAEGALVEKAYGKKYMPQIKEIPEYLKISTKSFIQELSSKKGGTELRSLGKELGGGKKPLQLKTTDIGQGKVTFAADHPVFGKLLEGKKFTKEIIYRPEKTTLYRGETTTRVSKNLPDWLLDYPEVKQTLGATGRWFTSSVEDAKWYANEGTGKISEITIPRDVAEKYRISNLPESAGARKFTSSGMESSEFFLPKEISELRQPYQKGSSLQLSTQPTTGRPPTPAEIEFYTNKYGSKSMQLKTILEVKQEVLNSKPSIQKSKQATYFQLPKSLAPAREIQMPYLTRQTIRPQSLSVEYGTGQKQIVRQSVKSGFVQVIEPSLQFGKREMFSLKELGQSELAGTFQSRRVTQAQSMTSEVISRQKSEQLLGTRLAFDTSQRYRQDQRSELRSMFSYRSVTDQGQRSTTDLITGITSLTTPRQTTRTITDTTTKPFITEIPKVVTYSWQGLPQGSGWGERRSKYKSPFREIIPYRSEFFSGIGKRVIRSGKTKTTRKRKQR